MAQIINSENDSAYLIHSSEMEFGYTGYNPRGPGIFRRKPPEEVEED